MNLEEKLILKMQQKNKKDTKIYQLIDPRDDSVKYVGWTSKSLKRRLSDHFSEARRGANNYKSRWIRKLFAMNLAPSIELLEDCDYEDRHEREIYWIAYYKRENLVNGTDGGEGAKGLIVSEETKDKLSKSHKGQVSWNKGISTDTSHLKKYQYKQGSIPVNKGKSYSEETRNKISTSKTDKHIGKKKVSISRYLGVTISKKDKKWIAQIRHNMVSHTIGRYFQEYHAAVAYDICYIYYVKLFDNLNIKENCEKYKELLMGQVFSMKELRIKIKDFINQEDT